MGTTIYLVRRAEALSVPESARDRTLSDRGAETARRVAERLRREGIDLVVSAPADAVRATVEPLVDRLGTGIVLRNEFATAARRRATGGTEGIDPTMASDGGEPEMTAAEALDRVRDTYAGHRVVVGASDAFVRDTLRHYGVEPNVEASTPGIYRIWFGHPETTVERVRVGGTVAAADD